jgi:hypothetical protein
MSLVLVLSLALLRGVCAQIEPLDVILPASSSQVQFVEGFIQAPGSVDLSSWKFSAVSEENDDFFTEGSRVDVVVFYQPSLALRPAKVADGLHWASVTPPKPLE